METAMANSTEIWSEQRRIAAEPASIVSDRIVIEMNGIAVKLPAETTASQIAEIVFALAALR
jgi:hypothetical protein